MKRNHRRISLPKDGIMTSDLWSQLSNLDRFKYLNGTKSFEDLKAEKN